MIKQLLLVLVAIVTMTASVTFGQSTTIGLDLRGTPDKFVEYTVDDPSDLQDIGSAGFFRPFAMDFDSTGTTLYAIDDIGNTLGTVDPATGRYVIVANLSGDLPFGDATGLSADPVSGTYYVCTATELYTLNVTTGATKLVATFSGMVPQSITQIGTIIDIAINAGGQMYAHDTDNDALWSIDSPTGVGTYIGPSGLSAAFSQGMDFDPDSDVLYAAIYTGGGTGSYGTWNTTTGVFTEILDFSSFPVSVQMEMTISGGTTYAFNFRPTGSVPGGTFIAFDLNDPGTLVTLFGTLVSYAMDFDPSGNNLIAYNNTKPAVGVIDTSTGEFFETAAISGDFSTGVNPTGMSGDSFNNVMYLSSFSELFLLDQNTGVTNLIGTFTGTDPNGDPIGSVVDIACNSTGQIFAHDRTLDCLWEVDPTTAVCTFVGYHGLNAGFAQGMDFDPATDILYAAIYITDGTGSYVTWDTTTGAITEILDLPSFPDPDGNGYQLEMAIKAESTGPIEVVANSVTPTRGDHVEGGIPELESSDNMDYSMRRRQADTQSRTEFEVQGTSPIASPTSFEFTLEGAVFARSNVIQTIELFDYDAAAWELVDTRDAARSPSPDLRVTVAATGDLSRFVEAGTMIIEARIRYKSESAPRQNFASNTDQTIWTIE